MIDWTMSFLFRQTRRVKKWCHLRSNSFWWKKDRRRRWNNFMWWLECPVHNFKVYRANVELNRLLTWEFIQSQKDTIEFFPVSNIKQAEALRNHDKAVRDLKRQELRETYATGQS